jgi:hypothetical protein
MLQAGTPSVCAAASNADILLATCSLNPPVALLLLLLL